MSEVRNSPQSGPPPPSEAAPAMPSKREPDFPEFPLLAPGSNDDDFMSRAYGKRLNSPEPDPILGQFITPTSADLPGDLGPKFTAPPAPDPTPRPRSLEDFPSINLENPAGPKADPRSDVVEEEEESEDRRNPWSTILLASYASAITLALGWFLIQDRRRDPDKVAPKPSNIGPAQQVSPGPRQAHLSGDVIPPELVVEVRAVEIGQSVTLGLLEITPVEVNRKSVKLQRSSTYSSTEPTRDGGKNALVLSLKLRNLSKDKVFAPLDQAYLRGRGKDVVDTYVTAVDGERIYPYPLAVDSELTVVGQDFTELRPGESRTVPIVSAPDAPPDANGPFTFRVRLRTGIDRNDAIEVRWPVNPPKN